MRKWQIFEKYAFKNVIPCLDKVTWGKVAKNELEKLTSGEETLLNVYTELYGKVMEKDGKLFNAKVTNGCRTIAIRVMIVWM